MGMHATFLQAAFPQQWKRKHFNMAKLLSNKVMLAFKGGTRLSQWDNYRHNSNVHDVTPPHSQTSPCFLKHRTEQYIKGL